MVSVLMVGIIFFGFALLIMLPIMLISWFFKGDCKIDVFEEREGQGLVCTIDDGNVQFIKRHDKIEAFKVMGTKFPLFKPVTRDFFVPLIKKKMDKIYCIRDKDGFIHPVGFSWNEESRMIAMRPYYRDQMDWMVGEHEERAKIKEKVAEWQVYLPHILIGLTLAVFLTTVILGWQYMQGVISTVSDVEKRIDAKYEKFFELPQFVDADTLKRAADIIKEYELETGGYTSQVITPDEVIS